MSEIVMAAMNGPGAPKIPAPQINFPVRSASDDSELPWPRMNKSEVQNYTTIFMDIDTNRDGSITRDEAHKNFSNGGYQELWMQGSQMMLTVTASKPRMQATSADWTFLIIALCLVIFSLTSDQTSSPSKPNFELHGMLLAMVVVLISSLEIIPMVVASLSAFAPQFNTFVSFAMGKILYRGEGILPQHTSWLKRRSHNSEI
ncbi:hypothetical protein ACFX13_035415 [Malus domestica]